MSKIEYMENIRSKKYSHSQIQKLRIGVGNRVKAWENKDNYRKKRGLPPISILANDRLELDTIFGDVRRNFEGLSTKEKTFHKIIGDMATQHILWIDWLQNVRGVGKYRTGVLISKLWDRTFKSRSALKKYGGQHCINGKAARSMKGIKSNWDPELKSFLWDMSGAGNSPGFLVNPDYHKYYVEFKEKDTLEHPEFVLPKDKPSWDKVFPVSARHPRRLHKRACKKTVNLFLSHLWTVMFILKNPGKKVPVPMHWKDTPLEKREILDPFGYKYPIIYDYDWYKNVS